MISGGRSKSVDPLLISSVVILSHKWETYATNIRFIWCTESPICRASKIYVAFTIDSYAHTCFVSRRTDLFKP